jgi:selenocysteine lyase/cysteine desulfurase
MERDGISLVAFAGHKGLLGPTGTGGLAPSDRFDESTLKPLVYGGTGSHSASTHQPTVLPDRFESGTQNLPGLAGLAAGCAFVRDYPGGPEALGLHERALASYFHRQATEKLPLFRAYVREEALSTGVLSFNLEGVSPDRVAAYLAQHGIACRAGLHCAAVAHQSLSTYPQGTVRFSFGAFNTKDEIDLAIDVLGKRIP